MDTGTNSEWQTSSQGTRTIFDGCRFHWETLLHRDLSIFPALNCSTRAITQRVTSCAC